MNPRAREHVSDALAILATHGITPTVDSSGRHVKVRWTDGHDRRFVLIIPQSPSDFRSRVNSRTLLRRLLRNGAGLRREA
jgi:hypothetical protein